MHKIKYDFVAPIMEDVFSGLKTTFDSVGEFVGAEVKARGFKTIDPEYDVKGVKSVIIKSLGGDLSIGETGKDKVLFSDSEHIKGKVKRMDDTLICKFFGSNVDMNLPAGIAGLTITQMGGDITANSSSENLNLSSKGGDTQVKLSNPLNLNVKNSGGDLICYLPESIDADISVSCMGGDFSSEIPYEGKFKKGKLDGTFGKGKKCKIEIKTLGGDINIKKAK